MMTMAILVMWGTVLTVPRVAPDDDNGNIGYVGNDAPVVPPPFGAGSSGLLQH